MATLPAKGLLDELVSEVALLHEAVLDARLHARLGQADEVEQRAGDGLIATRRIIREIRMNVVPGVEHARDVLRKARKEAMEGRMQEAFALLDGIQENAL